MGAWQFECVTAALPPAQSRLGPLVHWEPEGVMGGQEVWRISERVSVLRVFWEVAG